MKTKKILQSTRVITMSTLFITSAVMFGLGNWIAGSIIIISGGMYVILTMLDSLGGQD